MGIFVTEKLYEYSKKWEFDDNPVQKNDLL